MSDGKRREIPRFETPMIETHCHLDYLEAQGLDAVLAHALEVGVERVITIAVSPDNLMTVRALADTLDAVWGTQGIHPHEAERYDDAVEATLHEGLAGTRMVAVGEIGLDYYYDRADRAVQRRVFQRQLQLAAELELPVVIHTREADADTRDILRDCADSLPRGGVIHSFTASVALAEFCLEAGFCLGFNGIATFRTADNVREAVRVTPLHRLLLETDAPYLTPVPYRGKPNAPCYLPFIAEQLAAVKEIDVETLLQAAHRNSMALFFPDEPASTGAGA